LTPQEIIAELGRYEARISGILSRFRDYRIADPDADIYSQLIIETADLLTDAIGSNSYSTNIMNYYNYGVRNPSDLPSQKSVTEIFAVIRAAHTRLTRNPGFLEVRQAEEHTRRKENLFIIHGQDEAKWRELKGIVKDTFRLNPIILGEQPDIGKTVIEKFEHYATTCSYAIALFTPDNEVKNDGGTYLQARPNVIYELGWFCGRLERSYTMLFLKEGTSMFSDFGGIIQKRFKVNVSELEGEIRKDLTAVGILE
jgi:predicted nucleotide-binding protein